jgi:hypothetical protein
MFKSFPFRALSPIGTATILLSTLLCVEAARKIEVYDIPKESPAGHSHAGMAGGPGGGATDPHAGITRGMPKVKVAKLPEGWTENPSPGSMRAASYLVSDGRGNEAEVAVIPMTGMANIELQLVNMWREQVKLPAIAEADLGSQTTDVPVADGKGKLFELASQDAVIGGKQKARILVAMLKKADTTWFFKFAGEDQLVAAHKDRFLEFLKGVTFEVSALPEGHPPTGGGTGMGMGMGQGMMGGGGATVPPGAGDQPQWQIPNGWTEVAHSPFLVAKFQVAGDGGLKAEINVSTSSGDGGGLLANVNRWRGQLSLAAMDQAALDKIATSLDLPSGKATVVDIPGEGAENSDKMRCLGVMVPVGGDTWFYKLMGSESVVAREKEALLKFVRSVKY